MTQEERELEVLSVIEALEKTDKNKVKQTIENCVKVLRYDSTLSDAIKRNDLTGRMDVVKELPWEREGVPFTDTDFNQICLYLERYYSLTNDKVIRKAIDIVSSTNHYHPIRNALSALTWDGTERIEELFPRYLGAERSAYVTAVTKLFMLGAINRVFHPGCKFEIMLCIVGPQGAGKSTLFRFLALEDEWFSDDLRRIEDDNVYRKLQGHWIIEMAEMLATSNAKSIEEIKSFISRQKDTYKVPYELHPADRPRQCVFVGTSNSMSFLPFDRTGNRRFLPLLVEDREDVVHPLTNEKECREFVSQCWAEAMHIYNSGNYSLAMPKELETTVRELQKEFMPEDTKTGIVQAWLDRCAEEYVCTRMIFDLAFHKEGLEPTRKELEEINSIMRDGVSGWEPASTHRFHFYGIQRAWRREKSNQ